MPEPNRKSDWEAILELIHNNVDRESWSHYLQLAYNRFEFASNMLQQHDYRIALVTKSLREKYGYDLSNAYRDIKAAQELFGAMADQNKEFWRMMVFERIEATRRRAILKGDTASEAKCDTNLIKLFGLDKDTVGKKFDPKKLQQNVFNLTINSPAPKILASST